MILFINLVISGHFVIIGTFDAFVVDVGIGGYGFGPALAEAQYFLGKASFGVAFLGFLVVEYDVDVFRVDQVGGV